MVRKNLCKNAFVMMLLIVTFLVGSEASVKILGLVLYHRRCCLAGFLF